MCSFPSTLFLKGFLVFLIFIGVIGFSLPASAGILSFFEKIFISSLKQELSNDPFKANSQILPLLDAPTNINPLAGQGGAELNFVQNSALLSASGPLGSIADIDNKNSDMISIYVVRKGDTLSGIAKMFNVSINTIIWANNLEKGETLKIGSTLIILPVSGIKYEVQKGDTLEYIAKKFKGDINEIMSYNGLVKNIVLEPGLEIIIPNAEVETKTISPKIRQGVKENILGYYLRPINGGIKTQGIHGYNGVDLGTSCGEPIFASATGDVIISRSSGWNGGYGEYVAIDHPNNTQTLYAHLSSIIVGVGWHVVKGQVIGYVGSTGDSTGCHVHFEVRGARNPF